MAFACDTHKDGMTLSVIILCLSEGEKNKMALSDQKEPKSGFWQCIQYFGMLSPNRGHCRMCLLKEHFRMVVTKPCSIAHKKQSRKMGSLEVVCCSRALPTLWPTFWRNKSPSQGESKQQFNTAGKKEVLRCAAWSDAVSLPWHLVKHS